MNKALKVFTLVYVTQDGEVLLLNKNKGSQYLENKWLGLGGKVENGEDILNSAKREAKEEAGIDIQDAKIQGTFSWNNEEEIATIYLIVARKFKGKVFEKSPEGRLKWHKVEDLKALEDLADHQDNFLENIIKDENYIYSSFKAFSRLKEGEYTSIDYFKSRQHRSIASRKIKD